MVKNKQLCLAGFQYMNDSPMICHLRKNHGGMCVYDVS